MYNLSRGYSTERLMKSNDGLKDKIAVVTGATSGIGLHTTLAFARRGAFVIAVGRAPERCAEAYKMIESGVPHADVRYLTADLSLMSQVRQLATHIYDEINSRGSNSLDILVNNAGVFSETYMKTPEGFELTMAVNHFAPFLLSNQLIPLLAASRCGRIITLSSASHYRTILDINRLNKPIFYFGLWAYKVSKLANVLFTREFNRRMNNRRVRAFAVDPGLVNTDIGAKRAKGLVRLFWQLRAKSGVHPDVPVRTIMHLTNEALVYHENDVYWYDSHPLSPSRQALRDDLARDLWDFSCKTCGLLDP
jgi:NAD(P)-dependent dehydrogenase (short-subunit alcohol dehydrogenase family)